MFEQTDQKLSAWIAGVLGDTKISLEPPSLAVSAPTISLYLLNIRRAQGSHSSKSPNPQVLLTYLVTLQAQDQSIAHALMGTLVCALMNQTEFEYDLEPPPIEVWQTFGAKPSPTFLIKMPVTLPQNYPQVPKIRQPPSVRLASVATLTGQVLGPGDVPLVNAHVELTSLQRVERTDQGGYFTFSGIEPDAQKREFRIRAKQQELLVTIATPSQEPLVIHFDQLEI